MERSKPRAGGVEPNPLVPSLKELLGRLTPKERDRLHLLDQTIAGVLVAWLRQGARLRVITNATEGWADQHLPALPRVYTLMRVHSIPIHSARSEFEPQVGNDPIQWKFHSLSRYAKKLDPRRPIVSMLFADGEIDATAYRRWVRQHPSSCRNQARFVSFVLSPTPSQLVRQWKRIERNWKTWTVPSVGFRQIRFHDRRGGGGGGGGGTLSPAIRRRTGGSKVPTYGRLPSRSSHSRRLR
jgi:hypothetical protein